LTLGFGLAAEHRRTSRPLVGRRVAITQPGARQRASHATRGCFAVLLDGCAPTVRASGPRPDGPQTAGSFSVRVEGRFRSRREPRASRHPPPERGDLSLGVAGPAALRVETHRCWGGATDTRRPGPRYFARPCSTRALGDAGAVRPLPVPS